MAITTVAPAPYANGAAPNDLEDVTHTCVQCGITLIRTRRPFSSDTPAIAHLAIGDSCRTNFSPSFRAVVSPPAVQDPHSATQAHSRLNLLEAGPLT
jgi:hypothetical protein